jgi:hypothetical protein
MKGSSKKIIRLVPKRLAVEPVALKAPNVTRVAFQFGLKYIVPVSF